MNFLDKVASSTVIVGMPHRPPKQMAIRIDQLEKIKAHLKCLHLSLDFNLLLAKTSASLRRPSAPTSTKMNQ